LESGEGLDLEKGSTSREERRDVRRTGYKLWADLIFVCELQFRLGVPESRRVLAYKKEGIEVSPSRTSLSLLTIKHSAVLTPMTSRRAVFYPLPPACGPKLRCPSPYLSVPLHIDSLPLDIFSRFALTCSVRRLRCHMVQRTGPMRSWSLLSCDKYKQTI
jgi:hypothetical protein